MVLDKHATFPDIVLAIHGGAGAIDRENLTPDWEARCQAGLTQALRIGEAVWRKGGSAVEIVEAAVVDLEDNPCFNAGHGAVFTSAETIELDAAIMCGKTSLAGAVTGIKHVKNPVMLARCVALDSPFVLLAGEGAEHFAEEKGLPMVPNAYFQTPLRLEQLKRSNGKISLSEDNKLGTGATTFGTENAPQGTVGAVACDGDGHIAAATSTGGMTGKYPGRVGDTPIIGAGTWAEDATCAISATGHGEFFMRTVVAHEIASRMRYLGESLGAAAGHVVHTVLPNSCGGLIAIDAGGNATLPFNSTGMYRGVLTRSGEVYVAIYGK
jgi:L-asparaginase / beta-aspartyl-peptidase